MSALAELEPMAGIGHNAPPPTPFDTVKDHIEDLLTEAHNWADGTDVQTQAQADEASRLIEELRLAAKAADDLRVAEKKPLDDLIAEIQARFNHYIADPKTKNPGKVWKAIDAVKAALKPYLDRIEAEKRAQAERVRREAEEAARIAAEAARAAAASDLAAQEAADDLIAEAARLDAAAKRAEADKAHANGGSRAMGLKKTYTPVLTDPKAAMLHYMVRDREAFIALVNDLAMRDVREGKRQIPGFEIMEGTKL